MNILLIALGSHGDVHPFVGLGLRLRSRGNAVTVAANEHFKPLIERVGLPFLGLGTEEDYRRLTANPDLWHRFRALRAVIQGVMETVPPLYEMVERFAARHPRTGPEAAVVVSSSLGFGARVAQEKLGVATATVHLSPILFRSIHDTSSYPGSPIGPRTPARLKRAFFSFADKHFIDKMMAPPLNAFRSGLGLSPVDGILREWIHSPQLTIGMFPAWFAPQPDWPAQARLTGFPLYDESGIEPLSRDLVDFLQEGNGRDPPIAFTPGSAMWQGRRFFEAAAEACRRLGRRGLLLTRHPDHVPNGLPPSVRHVAYAPFSELLPQCAALVHHGGIGTSAQAMAAGVRQVVMPMAHDQPDNAQRMKRLGVARVLPPRGFRGRALARVLRSLLESREVGERCQAVAGKFAGGDALGRACELVEGLAGAG